MVDCAARARGGVEPGEEGLLAREHGSAGTAGVAGATRGVEDVDDRGLRRPDADARRAGHRYRHGRAVSEELRAVGGTRDGDCELRAVRQRRAARAGESRKRSEQEDEGERCAQTESPGRGEMSKHDVAPLRWRSVGRNRIGQSPSSSPRAASRRIAWCQRIGLLPPLGAEHNKCSRSVVRQRERVNRSRGATRSARRQATDATSTGMSPGAALTGLRMHHGGRNLVLAAALRLVERRVGSRHESVEARVHRELGDAEAHRHVGELAGGSRALDRHHGLPHSLRRPTCVGEPRARQDDGELFPAVARREVELPDRAAERGTRRADDVVAGLVTVAVVDQLEVVDVGDHE